MNNQIILHPSASNAQSSNHLTVVVNNEQTARKSFLEANTIEATLLEIRQQHIVPVFVKDNEPLISQVELIEAAQEVVQDIFRAERIAPPSIRLSHPIKGRVPEARNKPAAQLEPWEQTIYYERMAFIIEIPSISDVIDGERLSLIVGGIKAYNQDNLSNRLGTDQHFKIFIGFKVFCCTNLSVFTDGAVLDLKVKNLKQLQFAIRQLISGVDVVEQLVNLSKLTEYSLTEQQFTFLLGRCRMYTHLPQNIKQGVPELHFNDTQVNSVCRDYYRDNSFCREVDGGINLWKLHNLFTAANKTSYIDTFADRAVGATSFVQELAGALEHRRSNWFLC